MIILIINLSTYMLSLGFPNPTGADLGISILTLKNMKLRFWVIRDLLKVLMTLLVGVETRDKVFLSDLGLFPLSRCPYRHRIMWELVRQGGTLASVSKSDSFHLVV